MNPKPRGHHLVVGGPVSSGSLVFRYFERASSDGTSVYDHVDIVPPGPWHSRRVDGERECRLQVDAVVVRAPTFRA
jgi:hypothetical protein